MLVVKIVSIITDSNPAISPMLTICGLQEDGLIAEVQKII